VDSTVLSLLAFVAVALGVTAGYQILVGLVYRDGSRVRQRLGSEFSREQAPKLALFKNLDDLPSAADEFADFRPAARPTDGFPDPAAAGRTADPAGPSVARRKVSNLDARLKAHLDQAGVSLSVRQALAGLAGVALFLGVIGWWARGPLAAAVAATAGVAIPAAVVNARRNARREQLLGLLPKAFELMARVLRAGHSVPQALQAVADTFDGPLAAEFARCQQQQTLGLRPEITFQDMANRIGLLEMRIFVMAVLIQRQTGGNLSEMLERLATLLRDRLRLRRQVRTLTAEGRLQGMTLSVLPFLMFTAMMFVNREYAEVLLHQAPLLAATVASIGLGMLWIRSIVNFDF